MYSTDRLPAVATYNTHTIARIYDHDITLATRRLERVFRDGVQDFSRTQAVSSEMRTTLSRLMFTLYQHGHAFEGFRLMQQLDGVFATGKDTPIGMTTPEANIKALQAGDAIPVGALYWIDQMLKHEAASSGQPAVHLSHYITRQSHGIFGVKWLLPNDPAQLKTLQHKLQVGLKQIHQSRADLLFKRQTKSLLKHTHHRQFFYNQAAFVADVQVAMLVLHNAPEVTKSYYTVMQSLSLQSQRMYHMFVPYLSNAQDVATVSNHFQHSRYLRAMMTSDVAHTQMGWYQMCLAQQQDLQAYGHGTHYTLTVQGQSYRLPTVFPQAVYDHLHTTLTRGMTRLQAAQTSGWLRHDGQGQLDQAEIKAAQNTQQSFQNHQKILTHLAASLQHEHLVSFESNGQAWGKTSTKAYQRFFRFVAERQTALKRGLTRMAKKHPNYRATQQLIQDYDVAQRSLSTTYITSWVRGLAQPMTLVRAYLAPKDIDHPVVQTPIHQKLNQSWQSQKKGAVSPDGDQKNGVNRQDTKQLTKTDPQETADANDVVDAAVSEKVAQVKQQPNRPSVSAPYWTYLDAQNMLLIATMSLLICADIFIFDMLAVLWPIPVVFFVAATLHHCYEAYKLMPEQHPTTVEKITQMPAKAVAPNAVARTMALSHLAAKMHDEGYKSDLVVASEFDASVRLDDATPFS